MIELTSHTAHGETWRQTLRDERANGNRNHIEKGPMFNTYYELSSRK
jgi:hypothetical protein